MEPIIDIIASNPSVEIQASIHAALQAFNWETRGTTTEEPDFAIVLRDPETNDVCGGLYGVDGYGWAFIKLLVVPKQHRGIGLGRRHLSEAETIARGRGYIGVWLDTFEFQARPFYEKCGYQLFGQLEGADEAVPRYFLKKKF